MKISVITCTWNSMPYLQQSVESVLSQEYANIEYIFVDGGSDDGTLEFINSIPREKIVINNIRGGISNAMNVGIQAATGDLIAHMHSDDYYLDTQVLTKVVKAFEDTNASWLFGRIKNDIDGVLYDEVYQAPNFSYSALLKNNFVPHAATFVKRQVFQKYGMFSKSYKLAMDYEFWLRIAKENTPATIKQPLSAFRRHNGSATQANKLKSFNEDFKARFTHAPFYRWPEFILRYLIRRLRLKKL